MNLINMVGECGLGVSSPYCSCARQWTYVFLTKGQIAY